MNTGRSIAKGAVWVLLFKLCGRSLSLISIAVLARLLVPADFGIVALATTIIAALELFGNFSFDVALIQNQKATKEHYDTAFTVSLIFQMSIALLLLLLAAPAAAFYDEPALRNALMVLAIVPVIEGLQNIRIVDFRKQMLFHKDFVFMLSKSVIGFCVTIPAAFLLRDYWALILGIIAGRTGGTIASYIMIPYRPRFNTTYWTELFNFSKWLFLNNWLYFLRHRAAGFVIGKISGMRSLGVYEVSYEISNFATTELVAPINRAVLPGLAKIANDVDALRKSYLSVIAMIALLAVPAGIGIAAISEPLVLAFLGANWTEAIPIIAILGFAGSLSSIETNTGTTCVAVGRPELLTKLYGFYVAVLLTLVVVFTLHWGIIGTAWAALAAAIINVPVYYTVLLRLISLKVSQFLSVLWRPLVASACMYGTVQYYLNRTNPITTSVEALTPMFTAVAIGAAVYVILVIALWRIAGKPDGAEREILKEVVLRYQRLRR